MYKNIPYGSQFIDNEDISLVSKSLKKNLITTGEYVKNFEKKNIKISQIKIFNFMYQWNFSTTSFFLCCWFKKK